MTSSASSASERISVNLPLDVLDRLRVRYSEPQRRYHTWPHVLACLEARERLVTEPAPAVDLALLFHDAVYEPLASDNEQRSADLLHAECCELALPPDVLEAATAAILATRHGASEPVGEAASIVCDADLSILAADRLAYALYERQVRDEFRMVDDATWSVGRARVLRGFLARPRIFTTARGHELWEAAARHNLETSLWALGQ